MGGSIVFFGKFQRKIITKKYFWKYLYRWTLLYARDRDFAYKKTNDHCNFEDRFQKKGHFSTAYT